MLKGKKELEEFKNWILNNLNYLFTESENREPDHTTTSLDEQEFVTYIKLKGGDPTPGKIRIREYSLELKIEILQQYQIDSKVRHAHLCFFKVTIQGKSAFKYCTERGLYEYDDTLLAKYASVIQEHLAHFIDEQSGEMFNTTANMSLWALGEGFSKIWNSEIPMV